MTLQDEASSSSSINPCSQCQKPATFMCSSCNHDGPRYCSVECQKLDWKQGHYKNCVAAKKNRQLHRQAVESSMGVESTSKK